MTRATAAQLGGQNVCAFLDMLAVSEGTQGRGDDGYNVIVGGTLFNGYAAHPQKAVWLPRYNVYSTAAGRYQFLKKTWSNLQGMLHLSDFSPLAQDLAAVELIRGRGALADVKLGRFAVALKKCAKEWASLPGAGYGQRELSLSKLQTAYAAAGGIYA
ncbi:MAG: glycoside hydrolase family 104 protein [Oxalobacteraceae bacterium]|nr:glycoside hydrolase family 104 protein [Oxalobacteraceae bacterium]